MGRSFFLDVLVDRLQLERVIIFAGLDNVIRIYDVISSSVGDLCVFLKYGELYAGKDLGLGIFIRSAVPRLYHPVIEDLSGRSSCCGACIGDRIVLMQQAVGRGIGPAVCIVYDGDPAGADDHFAPFGIEIDSLGDPETVFAVIAGNIGVDRILTEDAPLIHGIGKIFRLIVCRTAGDLGRLVKYGSIRPVPAVEFITGTLACRRRDLSAVRNAEAHLLVVTAPGKGHVFVCFRMQEYAILDLTPLGIDSDAADRHLVPGIRYCAAFVDIPAFEDKSGFTGRELRRIAAVLFRNLRTLADRIALMQKLSRTAL